MSICSLINSQAIKDIVAHDAIYSDNELLDTQVPSNTKMFAMVQHLTSVVVQLQTKVANLEQLAYIRKPKPDIKDALATRAAKPGLTFRAWINRHVVATITRATLTSCMAHQVSLMETMCKILVPDQTPPQQPIYANNSKTGSFMIYDRVVYRYQTQMAPDALEPTDDFESSESVEYEWQPLTPTLFQWMINATHRQLLSEYRAWTVDANDNSDEFIETSMRFGAIILGGSMEWSSFMTKLNSRLWALMVEKQVSVFNE